MTEQFKGSMAEWLVEQFPEWRATTHKAKKSRICRLQHKSLEHHTITVRAQDKASKFQSNPPRWITGLPAGKVWHGQDFIYHAGKKVIGTQWADLDDLGENIHQVHAEVLARLGTTSFIRCIIEESVPGIPFQITEDIGWGSDPATVQLHLPSIILSATINNDGLDIINRVVGGTTHVILDLANPGLMEQVAQRIMVLLRLNSTEIIRTTQNEITGNSKAIQSLTAKNEVLGVQLQWLRQNLYI